MSPTVLAAGGVVWRGSSRAPEIAVIHRPHRHDWSLPKGKLNRLEAAPFAAAREVLEETGLNVALQHRLGATRYRVDGVPKVVQYWSMRYVDGDFVPNDEADDLRWLRLKDAQELLDFPVDREIVKRFTRVRPPDTAVLLTRHARAGKRSLWKKDDDLRPLDAEGRRQSQAIASFAALFQPQEICAAKPLRCVQTMVPLADKLGLPVNAAPVFSDEEFEQRPKDSLRALRSLGRSNWVVVVSSQGSTIPGLLAAIDSSHRPHISRKGSIWAVFFARGEFVQADYYERP